MAYMERYFDKRVNPAQLVPGAKSVVVLSHNYYAPEKQTDPKAPKISRYAWGDDYHKVLQNKLKALLYFIGEEIGDVNGRCFVDSAPVLERAWAKKAGLGWTGKNTLLINPRAGSYYFLAILIIDLEIAESDPIKDYCGTCRRCIEACPTDAILDSGYLLDASKCISYLTIELRENIPENFKLQMNNWVFGCDVCQEVCPWNRFSSSNTEHAFQPQKELLEMTHKEWYEITEEVFSRLFKESAVKRTKYTGLKRNLDFLQSPGR